jgi:hypothetical protein
MCGSPRRRSTYIRHGRRIADFDDSSPAAITTPTTTPIALAKHGQQQRVEQADPQHRGQGLPDEIEVEERLPHASKPVEHRGPS